MKKFLIFLLIVSLIISLFNCDTIGQDDDPDDTESIPNIKWPLRIGGINYDNSSSIKICSNNNIYISGTTKGNADFDSDGLYTKNGESNSSSDNYDGYIASYDKYGNYRWSKRIGGANDDGCIGITVDNNNRILVTGYVNGNVDLNGDGDTDDENETGSSTSNIIILIYDASGNFILSKRFSGRGNCLGKSISINSLNDLIITGEISGTADLNNDGDTNDTAEPQGEYGVTSSFVAVYDADGDYKWAKRIGGTSRDTGNCVTVDSDNNIIITGLTAIDSDLNGDGDLLDSGESGTGYGGGDIYLTSFSSSGDHNWSKRIGGTNTDEGSSVVADSKKNIFVTGYVIGDADLNGDGDFTDTYETVDAGDGSYDIVLSCFDENGNFKWAKRIGGIHLDQGRAVSVDSKDNIIVSGRIVNDSDLNGDGDLSDDGESGEGYNTSDIFITSFDSEGNHNWSKRFGGLSSEITLSMDIKYDIVFFTGLVSGNSDLNGDGITNTTGGESSNGFGNQDAFISPYPINDE